MRLTLAASLALALATPAQAEDGAALYAAQCRVCHSLTGVSGPAGPSLKGVAGRPLATAPGYAYSAGLKARGGSWSDAALDAYLANPAGYAPGTKMFNRVPQPATRAALIAYLKTQK